MCGIAGIAGRDGREVEPAWLFAMADRLRHRGPDDEGYLLVGPDGAREPLRGRDTPRELEGLRPREGRTLRRATAALAHRRFSILDLSPAGHQPFFDAEEACAVAFNGEIYNHLELRRELEGKGRRFRTRSDTEVLAEAYREWGTGCFERLNGMWALALYDFRERRLLLSRDRLGKLPLYWAESDGRLYFASEIKALLAVPALKAARAVEPAAVFPYLAYGRRDQAGRTFFAGVRSFPAGAWADAKDPPDRARRFWSLPERRRSERELGPGEAAERLRALLADAVRLRLRADVPWCVYLSGGMDSSALAALALRDAGSAPCFTVRFPGTPADEEPYAKLAAEALGAERRVLEPTLGGFWREVRRFTWLEEEPYHSPVLHVDQLGRRRMRSEGFKVLLSGAGGDELFGGYREHYFAHQRENLLKGRLGAYASGALRWTESRGTLWALKGPVSGLLRGPWRAPRPGDFPWIRAPAPGRGEGFRTLGEALREELLDARLPYWLRSGDKTHMGIPMEQRSPFLDHRVVELAFSLPEGYLLREGWHKWVLRLALEPLLPEGIVWRRRKMGFSVPTAEFLRESRPRHRAVLRRGGGPFADLERHPDPEGDFRLVSFLLWHAMFIEEDPGLFDELEEGGGPAGEPASFLEEAPWG